MCHGQKEEITQNANYPYGKGGCGQRHWVGDGSNKNSGGTALKFNSPQKELWIRWYMRYEKGFKWNKLHYDKILYIRSRKKNNAAIVEWYGSNGFDIYAQAAGGRYPCRQCGWLSTMRSMRSDGKWHYYEIHIKMDTNGRDGVSEAWIDRRKIMSNKNVNFGSVSGWTWFTIGSNQALPDNGRCMYVDFDEIYVSNTGRIGPVMGDKIYYENKGVLQNYKREATKEENNLKTIEPPKRLRIDN
ncbi:hypothetical protein ACFL2O_06135 [Thermodesulfobacteriota bacterium]